MALTAKGIVLREHNVGEADRFVTVLTDECGVIRASVRGARKVNSRAGASTRMFSYSSLSLVRGRNKYIVETAVPERVFLAMGAEMEQVALGQYFCELFGALSPHEEEASAYLRLLLNALHLLEQGKSRAQIKAVVELRLLSLAGYAPDLTDCRCQNPHPSALWLLPRSGVLRCERCGANGYESGVPLSASVLAAMRHIVYGEKQKCFAFRLPASEQAALADVTERFLTAQLSRSFQTLSFYHSLEHIG